MKKAVIILPIAIVVLAAAFFIIRALSGTEAGTWVCEDGTWVQQGTPDTPKPATVCAPTPRNVATVNAAGQQPEYNWSTSTQGPYRDSISYATSADLLTWADSGVTLAQHASVPGAVIRDGTIYVYFVDVSTDGIAERLALIQSRDSGKTWTDKEIVTITGAGDRVPVDPAPFVLDDGSVRLYYFDIGEGRASGDFGSTNKIYSALSDDGITFVQEQGVRFEDNGIFDPDVEKEGNAYRMYTGNIETNEVISAVSSDGLTFTNEGVAYSGGAVPDVIAKGAAYYLFTAGIDSATSADGKVFTKTNSSFHREGAGITADPSVVQLPDGTYIMFYKYK
ncbi:MAG: hypothetical protein PHY34_01885 [Patescibacteria group bacterium]|nr:hypothetical protein [Patescibacteria group bacterium]MDD5715315.1 hypothetical protein [Patescibacteria group bacterium]